MYLKVILTVAGSNYLLIRNLFAEKTLLTEKENNKVSVEQKRWKRGLKLVSFRFDI